MRKLLLVLPLLTGTTVMSGFALQANPAMISISNEVAANIRGGGCGSATTSTPLKCVGTQPCNGNPDAACSGTSLTANDHTANNTAGGLVPTAKVDSFQCIICGTVNCGTAIKYSKGTQGCIASTTTGTP